MGIFGDWGSGKTFFMRRLKARIEERSRLARESGLMQREVSFAKQIVQVEFNAWHYSGGNLWAALVQHIFDNLSLFGDEPEGLVAQRQRHILERMEKLDDARTALLSASDEAQEDVDAISRKLEEVERKHEEKLDKLRSLRPTDVASVLGGSEKLREEVRELARQLGLDVAAGAAQDLAAALDEGRALLRRASPFLAVGRGTGWMHGNAAVVTAVLAGPAAAALAALVFRAGPHEEIAAAISGGAATISAGATWARHQYRWIAARISDAEGMQSRLAQRVRDAEAEQHAERLELESELRALETEVGSLRAQIAQNDADRAELAQELEGTTPARVLAEYILTRAASDDYRKHLGLHARIKEDFDRIAKIIDDDRRAVREVQSLEAEEKDAAHRIDRIVLFIDDLDRCEPEKVVEVLRAMHLLLAFPLFVVVVGIDARWGKASLEKSFPGLFDRELDSVDFLEKLFQIPFWLERIQPERRAGFVTGVVGEVHTPEATPPGPVVSSDDSTGVEGPPPAAEASDVPSAGTATTYPAPPRPELNPTTLRMNPKERQFLAQVGPLPGPSPRSIKRFVNLYRLAKALASDPMDFTTERLGHGAPYQAVMLLLAIETGPPEHGKEIFRWVREWKAQDGASGDLGAALETLRDSKRQLPEWADTLHAWTDASDANDRGQLDMELLRAWAPTIARYSFRADSHFQE